MQDLVLLLGGGGLAGVGDVLVERVFGGEFDGGLVVGGGEAGFLGGGVGEGAGRGEGGGDGSAGSFFAVWDS